VENSFQSRAVGLIEATEQQGDSRGVIYGTEAAAATAAESAAGTIRGAPGIGRTARPGPAHLIASKLDPGGGECPGMLLAPTAGAMVWVGGGGIGGKADGAAQAAALV